MGNEYTFSRVPEQFINDMTKNSLGIAKAGKNLTATNGVLNVKLPGGIDVNENGEVFINAGDGLQVNNTSKEIETVLGNGLTYTDEKSITINGGNGITTNNGLGIKAGNGIQCDEAGVSIKKGNATYIDETGINIKVGNGLKIVDNKITAVPGKCMEISENKKLALTVGDGLLLNSSGVSVDYSTNLGIDSQKRLYITKTFSSPSAGVGIKKNGSTYSIKASDGLSVDSSGINVKLGTGLKLSNNAIIVSIQPVEYSAGGGIAINGNTISLKDTYYGLPKNNRITKNISWGTATWTPSTKIGSTAKGITLSISRPSFITVMCRIDNDTVVDGTVTNPHRYIQFWVRDMTTKMTSITCTGGTAYGASADIVTCANTTVAIGYSSSGPVSSAYVEWCYTFNVN